MLKNVISQGDFAIWPSISTVLFFATFLGILIWVYRPKARRHYEDMAQMAIEDQTTVKEGRHER